MITNQKLFSIGTFDFRFQHLLIIAILSISFSISMIIKSQPANYGFELNEFDPFFNYRATQYLLENGLDSYNSWHDDMSWHPYGRNVSETSQVMLHFTTALFYKIFGFGYSLYDFTIIFPVIFSSITAIVVFAIIRVIGGTTTGLIASLLFSISWPIAVRSFIGWFKSEPLGLFFGLLSLYFLLSAINTNKGKIPFIKIITAGIFFSFGLASWGGNQFFLIPTSVFILTLPFLKNNSKFLLYSIPLFVASILLSTLLFERPGISFVFGYGGLLLLLPTVFLIIFCLLKNFISKKYVFYLILIGIISIGSFLIISEQIGMPTFRYLNAINPTLVSNIPLVDSVSEHVSASTKMSFSFFSILLIFSGIGIWHILQKKSVLKIKKEMIAFILIFGIFGVYTSSVFVRLEVFASLSIIFLSSIGVYCILNQLLKKQHSEKNIQFSTIIFLPIIIILLTIPIFLPSSNWISGTDHPPTLMSGGNTFGVYNNDWKLAMDWLKNNTDKNAVIASWWDYGYWITTLGERKSLVDNATLIDWQIQKIGFSLMSQPNIGWQILNSSYDENISEFMSKNKIQSFGGNLEENLECNESIDKKIWCNPVVRGLNADYILLYMTATPIPSNHPQQLYILNGGGDFQKKFWFMSISESKISEFLHPDGETGTKKFWNETLLGNLIPFSPIYYVDQKTGNIYHDYVYGSTAVYVKNVKYFDNSKPFQLKYASPSFLNEDGKSKISSILIYEINKDFTP